MPPHEMLSRPGRPCGCIHRRHLGDISAGVHLVHRTRPARPRRARRRPKAYMRCDRRIVPHVPIPAHRRHGEISQRYRRDIVEVAAETVLRSEFRRARPGECGDLNRPGDSFGDYFGAGKLSLEANGVDALSCGLCTPRSRRDRAPRSRRDRAPRSTPLSVGPPTLLGESTAAYDENTVRAGGTKYSLKDGSVIDFLPANNPKVRW